MYESLCSQTFRDFEWLIVDDGSTDGTEPLVRTWQRREDLAIRYFYQRNQGRHRAYNRAIELAGGDLFAMLDSDDVIVPNALERLLFHWRAIPEPERPAFSGVTCLCVDQSGKLVGRAFPKDRLDCAHFEAATRHRATGEKWGFHRTDVIKEFPFPDIPGEKFCAEGLIWNRVGRHFLMRHVNEPLKVYTIHSASITANVNAVRMHSPNYARLYYREYLDLDVSWGRRMKAAVNYDRFSMHAGLSCRRIIAESGQLGLARVTYLAGVLLFGVDKLRSRLALP